MSINSELEKLDAVRDALVSSVNSKGGSLPEDATLWQVKAGVDAIQQGGGTDAPVVTQPAPEVSIDKATGKVTAAYTPRAGLVTDTGAKTGTLQLETVAGQTITPGETVQTITGGAFLTGDIVVDAVENTGGGGDGSVDTSDLSATADDVLEGKTFYGKDSEEPQTGTIPVYTELPDLTPIITWSGQTATISTPVGKLKTGYYKVSALESLGHKIVEYGTKTVDVSPEINKSDGPMVRITYDGGWHSALNEARSLNLPKIIARDYTPGTEDIVIPPERWIIGGGADFSKGIVIKGDANLLPENIKGGVEIFGVTGNFAGGGGGAFDLVKVTDPSSLRGVKAISYNLSSRSWTWGDDEFTFTSAEVTPTTDSVYAATGNALIGSRIAWAGEFPTDGMIFYAPLLTETATAETGQALIRNGSYTFNNGVVFGDNGSMSFEIGSSAPQGIAPATASIWFNGGQFGYEQLIIGWGSEGNVLSLQMDTSGILYATNRNGQRIDSPNPLNDDTWHHFCVTTSGGYATMYVDGNKVAEGDCGINISGTGGGIGGGWWRNTMYANGTMRAARIYNRVLSDDEIMALAGEF